MRFPLIFMTKSDLEAAPSQGSVSVCLGIGFGSGGGAGGVVVRSQTSRIVWTPPQ